LTTMKKLLCGTLGLMLSVATAAGAATPVSGIDLMYLDRSVRPQDDFYQYVNGGWLATTARRKALDRLRRDKVGERKLALLAVTDASACPDGPATAGGQGHGHGHGQTQSDGPDGGGADRQADDELLSLVFACCHPALGRDAQVALTLRAVCGLTGEQIARAFLVSDATMSQRLLRARKTLADEPSPVRIPDPDELADRLAQAAREALDGVTLIEADGEVVDLAVHADHVE